MKDCNAAISKSKQNGGYIDKRNWETLKKKVNNMLARMWGDELILMELSILTFLQLIGQFQKSSYYFPLRLIV